MVGLAGVNGDEQGDAKNDLRGALATLAIASALVNERRRRAYKQRTTKGNKHE
jgi:hypothetical protein